MSGVLKMNNYNPTELANIQYQKDIAKLKEKNEELKNMNAKKHKYHKNKCKEVKDLRWLMNTRAGEHLDDKQKIVELKKVISDRDDEMQHKNKLFEEWGAENKELKEENDMLRDLLQSRVPVGCICETTYQPILDENEKLKEEVDNLKDEMVTMYHIIMNDGDKYEISKDQPLLKMVQFNIGLMLEKFKEMGGVITELKKTDCNA
jgi:hypothetical protein